MEAAKKERLLEAIKGLIEDPKEPVRHTAVMSLSQFEETRDVSVPLLIETVIEGDKRSKGHAQAALVAVGEEAIEPVIEGLIKHEDDADARLCGISILSEIYLLDRQRESKTASSCDHSDPHGIGPIVKRALVDAVREALAEKEEE